jgi:hypothetical protein
MALMQRKATKLPFCEGVSADVDRRLAKVAAPSSVEILQRSKGESCYPAGHPSSPHQVTSVLVAPGYMARLQVRPTPVVKHLTRLGFMTCELSAVQDRRNNTG